MGPKVDTTGAHITVQLDGDVIADTKNAVIVTEGSPVYYFPPSDVRTDRLTKNPSQSTFCPWKGKARYYDYPGKSGLAWYYPEPKEGMEAIKGYIAFYGSKVDGASADGQSVKVSPW